MFQRLTPDEIKSYSDSSEIKFHIDELIGKMKQQGLTLLFIDPKVVFDLASELKKEGVLDAKDAPENYSVERIETEFKAHIERKFFELLSLRENVTHENIAKMAGLIAGVLFTPKNAHVLFSWLAEFVYPMKEKFSGYLRKLSEQDALEEQDALDGFSWTAIKDFWKFSDRRMSRIEEMYEQAMPCGMNSRAEHTIWKYCSYQEFKAFDVSSLMNIVEFERYYNVAFRNAPTYENVLCGELKDYNFLKLDLESYRKKDDLKKEISTVFKLMVFDAMIESFDDPEEFYELNHKDMLQHLLGQKFMWVCFMYIEAMMYVNRGEYERITKLMQRMDAAPWGNANPI